MQQHNKSKEHGLAHQEKSFFSHQARIASREEDFCLTRGPISKIQAANCTFQSKTSDITPRTMVHSVTGGCPVRATPGFRSLSATPWSGVSGEQAAEATTLDLQNQWQLCCISSISASMV